jgi:hypothetical protein
MYDLIYNLLCFRSYSIGNKDYASLHRLHNLSLKVILLFMAL